MKITFRPFRNRDAQAYYVVTSLGTHGTVCRIGPLWTTPGVRGLSRTRLRAAERLVAATAARVVSRKRVRS